MVSLNILNRLVSAMEKRYGLGPLGLQRSAVGQTGPDVSLSSGSTIIRKVGNLSPNNKASRPTRHESSAMQVWEPQLSESHVPCEVQTDFFFTWFTWIACSIFLSDCQYHSMKVHAALIGRTSERNLEASSKAILYWKSEALETKVP